MWSLELPAVIYVNTLVSAAREELSPYYILAVIWWESGFQWDAIGDEGKSFGLMQLHIEGAGAGYRPEELLDISNNIRIGARHLRWCRDQAGGDLRKMFAYYRHPALATGAPWGTDDEAYADGVLALYQRLVAARIAIVPDEGGRWVAKVEEVP